MSTSILPFLSPKTHGQPTFSPQKRPSKGRVAFNLALPPSLAACHYVIRGDKWNFPSLRPDWSVNAVPMRILSSPLWSGLAPTMRTVAFLITHGREEEDGKGHIKRTPSFRAKQGFTLTGWRLLWKIGRLVVWWGIWDKNVCYHPTKWPTIISECITYKVAGVLFEIE